MTEYKTIEAGVWARSFYVLHQDSRLSSMALKRDSKLLSPALHSYSLKFRLDRFNIIIYIINIIIINIINMITNKFEKYIIIIEKKHKYDLKCKIKNYYYYYYH